MPTFCRHNRFLANCPICSRDRVEVVTPQRSSTARGTGTAPQRRRSGSSTGARAGAMRVRHVARDQDDGFRSELVPGVKASGAAERLAEEIAFAAARLAALEVAPPGLYAAAAAAAGPSVAAADREEALWLLSLIAYLGPLDAEDPFAAIDAVRVPWADGALPDLDGAALGPRSSHEPGRGDATLAAYRAWAQRAGSQAAGFAGEEGWSPERRFARAYERLALPGLQRDARFDLLVTIGRLGLAELRPGALQLGGGDDTTVAAKRVFGIADTLLLERRAAELAEAGAVPLAALDLALWNWNRPPASARAAQGAGDLAPDADAYARVATALGL